MLRDPSGYVGERGAEVFDHMAKSLIDKYSDDQNEVNIKIKNPNDNAGIFLLNCNYFIKIKHQC